MIPVEVRYRLEIPQIDFTCPFCKELQTRNGGHVIDEQVYPNPKDVVSDHLNGEDRCVKFNRETDSLEELQISAVQEPPVQA